MMERRTFIKQSGTILGGALVPGYVRKSTRDHARLRPAALKPGDRVAFAAPAGRLYDMTDLDRMEKVMNEMGLEVVFGEHVRSRHGYFAGKDHERAEDLNRFFADPDIQAIIAVRGGWGCNRILPLLDYESLSSHPKIICGFSDITSLHLAIWSQIRMITYHGPNGTSDWTDFTRNWFKRTLFDGDWGIDIRIPDHQRYHFRTLIPGMAEGMLLGGNLTLVTSLVGTPYFPDKDRYILFLEDIGEEVYRIDRLLTQLKLAGLFDRLDGLIFGLCSNCKMGPGASLTLDQMLHEQLDSHGIPAFYGAAISHEPDNLTIPQGVKAQMDADKGTLRLMESPVEK
jgi:muramoyltetrapeptide carboxypeptidase